MTTRDFIARHYREEGRVRHCSSVFKDEDGNMYSYGYHYPLLFNIEGLDFVNTRGYSNTTGKHIGWARGAYPQAIPVELHTHEQLSGLTLDDIQARLQEECNDILKQMETKKRKDTQVYHSLREEAERLKEQISTVTLYLRR